MNRHDLAYLDTQQHFTVLSSPSHIITEYIQRFIEQGLPFTVCRQNNPQMIKLAISCIIEGKKQRIAIGIDNNPKQITTPLLLNNLHSKQLTQVQKHIDRFISQCHQLGASIYVYGSYANEHLMALPFTHKSSDLDLLIVLDDKNHWLRVLELIIHFKYILYQTIGLNIDGEIRIDGKDISFNELILCIHEKTDTIVIKNLTDIDLANIHDIFKGDDNEFNDFRKRTATTSKENYSTSILADH